jgi:hypothetical protein
MSGSGTPTERELWDELETLGASPNADVADYLWADLKNAHGGRLTPAEQRLLNDPGAYLADRIDIHTDPDL